MSSDKRTMEAAADRLLANVGTDGLPPAMRADVEAVARWAQKMLAWLRARAVEAQR